MASHHRCHKKEFPLKFAKDRTRWLQWLFEAKKRYEFSILNYMVTSNHIHLLVFDNGRRDVIAKSVQFIETKTRLGYRASGRAPREADGVYELRESHGYYGTDSGPQKATLSSENTRFWNVCLDKPES